MSVMDRPLHPVVQTALDLSRELCRGHTIDDAPALRHAVLVARTLVRHVPDAPARLVAAALLHDSPLFASAGTDLPAVLDSITPGLAALVLALDEQHRRMDQGLAAELGERAVTLVAAADKVIAFRSLVTRAHRCGDQRAFWSKRTALRNLLPYFHDWYGLALPVLPPALAADLSAALSTLEDHMAMATLETASPGQPFRIAANPTAFGSSNPVGGDAISRSTACRQRGASGHG